MVNSGCSTAAVDQFIRILLLGDRCVGKTSLVNRWINKEFGGFTVPTIGITFASTSIDHVGKKLRMIMWDTCGEDRYKTIKPIYYREANVIILTYDISDCKSFKHIEDEIAKIEEHVRRRPRIVLVGNKSDLDGSRQVSIEDGEAIARKHNFDFFEASAKTGDCVERIFFHAISHALARIEEEEEEEEQEEDDNTPSSRIPRDCSLLLHRRRLTSKRNETVPTDAFRGRGCRRGWRCFFR